MDMLKEQVKQTIREHHMLEPGSRVIAALSGGADSVCLLGLLKELEGEMELKLRAVHVHHGLRGQEADRDAEFAKAFCDTLSVPCHIIKADVKKLARDSGMSEEEAGRRLRYEILEQEASAWERDAQEGDSSPVRIATAHHSRDQAETILHNLCRGSGLKGIGGMEKRRGRLIRPLLEESREEILLWLERQGLEYCQDSTNFSDCYTRNRIRGQLIPLICQEINPKGVENIVRVGKLAAQADEYLRDQAEKWLKVWAVRGEDLAGEQGEGILLPETLRELPEILRYYVVRLALAGVLGRERDLTYLHVRETAALLEKQAGRCVSLPAGCRALRTYGGIRIVRGTIKGQTKLPQVKMQVFSHKKGMEFPKKQYTKWFDCDKIKGTLELRFRREGDYITLPKGGRKLLRRYMIDEKIPAGKRDEIPLLADGSHIMWIIGYRISEYYKIGPDTAEVLEVSLKDKNDEDTEEESWRIR